MRYIQHASSALLRTSEFLANLPEKEYLRLRPDLEFVSLKAGTTLHSVGKALQHVYFPTTCLVSSLVSSSVGIDMEVQLVGAHGMVGEAAVFGNRHSPTGSLVVVGGDAYRLPTGWFKQEFRQYGALHDFALYHTNTHLMQSHRLVLCNHLHSIEERTARWLLTVGDIGGCHEIAVSHDTLSRLLGAHRPGVTMALNLLARAGAIICSRRRVIIADREALSAHSCDCYRAIRDTFTLSSEDMVRRGGPHSCRHLLMAHQKEVRTVEGTASLSALDSPQSVGATVSGIDGYLSTAGR